MEWMEWMVGDINVHGNLPSIDCSALSNAVLLTPKDRTSTVR
jgi:hypothetical protein